MRWMVAGLSALALIGGLATVARAASPPCFPERSVVFRADVADAKGGRLGVVRAGQVVRVLDDAVGPDGRHSLVEVDAPIKLRGLVEPKALRVFLRHDKAVEPGWVWRLAGTPVRILGATARGVRVTWVSRDEGWASELGPQEVACADIVGTPPLGSRIDLCHGVMQEAPTPAGEPIRLTGPDIPVLSGPKRITTIESHTVGLLRQARGRALIEAIEIDVHQEPLRIRAWIGPDGIDHPESVHLWAKGGCCCEALVEGKVGQRGAALTRDVELRLGPSAGPLVRIPAGIRFRVLGPVEGGMRKIAVRWPTWDDATFRLAIEGWAPANELPALGEATALPMLFGRVVVAGALASAVNGTIVSMTDPWETDGPPLQTKADAEGRFRFQIDNHKDFPLSAKRFEDYHFTSRIDAHTADGKLAGALTATVLPGGDEEVTLHLEPAVTIETRVRNQVGAWMPGGGLLAREYDSDRVSLMAHADQQGRALLPVPRGRYTMYSADLGTWQDRVEAAAPGKNTIVTQRRRPLILGAVPRTGTACAAQGVEVRGMHPFTRTFPVQPDCTFVASGFPWLHGSVDVRKLGDPEASWKQVRVRAGHLDPEPVCLGGDCGSDWARTAIHVSVVDAANVLAQGPAVVEATSANGARWSCETSAGTCLLAPLPMRRRFMVTARLGTRTGETSVNVASGVYDVLVALK